MNLRSISLATPLQLAIARALGENEPTASDPFLSSTRSKCAAMKSVVFSRPILAIHRPLLTCETGTRSDGRQSALESARRTRARPSRG